METEPHPTNREHTASCRCKRNDVARFNDGGMLVSPGYRVKVPRINLARHFMVNASNADALGKAMTHVA